MGALIEGQYDRLGILRSSLFSVIESTGAKITDADFTSRLEALRRLTNNGKDLSYIDTRVTSFLLSAISNQAKLRKVDRNVMALLANIIRYNFIVLDETIAVGLLRNTCSLCTVVSDEEDISSCLAVIDTFTRYGVVPVACLPLLVSVLCRTVNIEPFCETSWLTMRQILKSHVGYNVMRTMCALLEDPANASSSSLLRGEMI